MKHCRLCEKELMESGQDYLIEKACKNGEILFEHAVCLPCHARWQEELSIESRARIAAYFEQHAHLETRLERMIETWGTDHEKWLAHCMVKGYPIRECGEYQIYGLCSGDQLVFTGAPFMLSGEAVEEVMNLLSSETQGILNDLSERLFGVDAPKGLLAF